MFTSLRMLQTVGAAAGAAGMPAGALGIWNFDEYQTTFGNPIVPNSASAAPLYADQLFRQSRRISGYQGGYNYTTGGSFYFEADAANTYLPPLYTDMIGNTEAVLIGNNAASAWRLYQTLHERFPGDGTYTVSIDVKLISGTGKFKLGNPFGTMSSEFTATGSWQRFSYTASFTGWPGNDFEGLFGIFHDSPSDASSFHINHFTVHAGASDLGREVDLGGHLRIGLHSRPLSTYGNAYSYAGGILTGTEHCGVIQFEEEHLADELTAIFFGIPDPPFTDNINSILCHPTGDGFTCGLGTTANGLGLSYGPTGGVASFALLPYDTTTITWDEVNPHVYAVRYNGTACQWWEDGVLIHTADTAYPFAIPYCRDFSFNALTSHPCRFAYRNMAYYNRYLSDAEMAQAADYLLGL